LLAQVKSTVQPKDFAALQHPAASVLHVSKLFSTAGYRCNQLQWQPSASFLRCCLLQFADAKAEYNHKHEVYFRLHQEIQAHQRDLSGLRRAAQLAASPTEAKRWEDQVLFTALIDLIGGANTG
jgi:hypothetical protein